MNKAERINKMVGIEKTRGLERNNFVGVLSILGLVESRLPFRLERKL